MKHVSNIKRIVILFVVNTVLAVLCKVYSCDKLNDVMANNMRGIEYVMLIVMSVLSMVIVAYFASKKDEAVVVSIDSEY